MEAQKRLGPWPEPLMLHLEGGVGESPEGDGQPEVDGPVGQHTRQGRRRVRPETGDHGNQHELDDAQSARSHRDGGQDVGQSVGGEQVDGGDEVAEGRHEDPEGGCIENPVGRRPTDGPHEHRAIGQQDGESSGQAFHEGCGPDRIEEPDPLRDLPHDSAGPLLTAAEQQEDAAECRQQDDSQAGGHDNKDRPGE